MTYSMTTQEFVALAMTEPLDVLDLRDPDLFDIKDMKTQSAITRIPLTELTSRYQELDSTKTYYLFSQSGKRAKTMAHFLNENGYQAVNVIGGVKAVMNYLEMFHPDQANTVEHPANDVLSRSLIIIQMVSKKQQQAASDTELV
ncbi:rhodanese-like domain-containing protein [Enterococcus sp. AZ109]|uniref:rhodanese-like domain-containing protein n=1 Tax=Enterococcus sp. AZ109 TaxID=2774634 RepID=UPI003F25B58F